MPDRKPRHVYFARDFFGPDRLIKIGASRDPRRRMKGLTYRTGRRVFLLGVLPRAGMKKEYSLHERFASHRHHSEWYHPAPEIIQYVRGNAVEYVKPKPEPLPMPERYVRPEELAEALGWTPQQVRDEFRAGGVPGYQLSSRTIRFKRSEVWAALVDKAA